MILKRLFWASSGSSGLGQQGSSTVSSGIEAMFLSRVFGDQEAGKRTHLRAIKASFKDSGSEGILAFAVLGIKKKRELQLPTSLGISGRRKFSDKL